MESPFHCGKHLILFGSPHTLAGSHNSTLTLKNRPWLQTSKSKSPFENAPPWCEECYESSWKLIAAAIFAAVLKTNINSPFNENITWICIPSSRVISNPEMSEIKVKQWSRCWPSVTPAAHQLSITHQPLHRRHHHRTQAHPGSRHDLPATLTKSSSVHREQQTMARHNSVIRAVGGENIYSDLSCVSDTRQWQRCCWLFRTKGANLKIPDNLW